MMVEIREELREFCQYISPQFRKDAEDSINRKAYEILGHWNFERKNMRYYIYLEAQAEIILREES